MLLLTQFVTSEPGSPVPPLLWAGLEREVLVSCSHGKGVR